MQPVSMGRGVESSLLRASAFSSQYLLAFTTLKSTVEAPGLLGEFFAGRPMLSSPVVPKTQSRLARKRTNPDLQVDQTRDFLRFADRVARMESFKTIPGASGLSPTRKPHAMSFGQTTAGPWPIVAAKNPLNESFVPPFAGGRLTPTSPFIPNVPSIPPASNIPSMPPSGDFNVFQPEANYAGQRKSQEYTITVPEISRIEPVRPSSRRDQSSVQFSPPESSRRPSGGQAVEESVSRPAGRSKKTTPVTGTHFPQARPSTQLPEFESPSVSDPILNQSTLSVSRRVDLVEASSADRSNQEQLAASFYGGLQNGRSELQTGESALGRVINRTRLGDTGPPAPLTLKMLREKADGGLLNPVRWGQRKPPGQPSDSLALLKLPDEGSRAGSSFGDRSRIGQIVEKHPGFHKGVLLLTRPEELAKVTPRRSISATSKKTVVREVNLKDLAKPREVEDVSIQLEKIKSSLKLIQGKNGRSGPARPERFGTRV